MALFRIAVLVSSFSYRLVDWGWWLFDSFGSYFFSFVGYYRRENLNITNSRSSLRSGAMAGDDKRQLGCIFINWVAVDGGKLRPLSLFVLSHERVTNPQTRANRPRPKLKRQEPRFRIAPASVPPTPFRKIRVRTRPSNHAGSPHSQTESIAAFPLPNIQNSPPTDPPTLSGAAPLNFPAT